MIARFLDELKTYDHFDVVHLSFRFTKDVRQTRRGGFGKIVEVFAVLFRLARIRLSGPIDLLLYPVGGPQLVPLIRDLCLLPWMMLVTKKTCLHFHAAGIAETIDKQPFIVRQPVRWLYRKSALAIVMTQFGRQDAKSVGIEQIEVVPNTLEDHYDNRMLRRNRGHLPRLLYVGHFSEDKGTPSLLQAVANLRDSGWNCLLTLVGETVPPYTDADLQLVIDRLDLQSTVQLCGVLSGKPKWSQFAEADLVVFPSLAAESFGLSMVEGMMWALPIVACDWRGNREVLGDGFGGVLFQPSVDFTTALTKAIERALAERHQWTRWGLSNREIFLKRYTLDPSTSRLGAVLDRSI
jgi:glycosyltransferase involved in cell wall biosynthesis